LGDIVAAGGTEAAYRAEQNDWLIHLHLPIGDLDSSAEERLRALGQRAKSELPSEFRRWSIRRSRSDTF
jgi:hypothetical protein